MKPSALSPWTVRQYIRRQIKAVRIGQRVLIEPSELENLTAGTYQGRSKVA
jgi:hypothetical protein